MKKAHIVYGRFYDYFGEKLVVGGVETYIINLSKLLYENGYQVHIYQYADKSFEKIDDFFMVHGVFSNNNNEKVNYYSFKTLVRFAEQNGNYDNDLFIFGADLGISKTKYKKVIAIQHGIGWDIQPDINSSIFKKIKYSLTNFRVALNRKKRFSLCKKIVCVDYNFLNWYRTTIYDNVDKIVVIPNFTRIIPFRKQHDKKNISIIFARRLQYYRGTRVFCDAIEKFIRDFPNINVLIAGDGSDEKLLHSRLDQFSQVVFDKFHPDDSLNFHKNYDIAVVPSIGSEGTSLSLLEAMAAGCAVICSDIGGLTNIILDNFNGLIIRANSEELYNALKKLMDYNYRCKISKNAYNSVSESFSYEKWSSSWLNLINNI